MAKSAKIQAVSKRTVKTRGARRSTRKVIHRFRGIDRGLSKAVFVLESRLALAQRELKAALKRPRGTSKIEDVYKKLNAPSRRKLLEHAVMLQAVQNKA